MKAKRIVFGVALGLALTLGWWATEPGTEPARAQDVTFQCSKTGTAIPPFPPFPVVATLNNVPLAAAAPLLADGWTCIPQAAADASPRFNCVLQGRPFSNRTITSATAILRTGGQCTPAIALPALPTLPS